MGTIRVQEFSNGHLTLHTLKVNSSTTKVSITGLLCTGQADPVSVLLEFLHLVLGVFHNKRELELVVGMFAKQVHFFF